MSRAKVQLSREEIAAAALAIADAEGFQAVSMRRVAPALNAGTMSLYYEPQAKVLCLPRQQQSIPEARILKCIRK